MSKIDDMIAELCPDGVEYKAMEECGTFLRGSGIQKKDFRTEGKPCIHYGQIYTKFGLATDHALSLIAEEQFEKAKKAMPGAVIIAITSENIDDVCTPLVWEGNEPVAISGHSCAYQTTLNPRYVAYYLSSEAFQRLKVKIARGTKVIEVKPADLARIEIPVPPMEVQREIVRVLDSFADLEAELEAELKARKQQYAYYRDRLLTFERERVQWLRLGDIGQMAMCKRIFKNQTAKEGDIPFYKIGTFGGVADAYISADLYNEYRKKYRFPNKGDILISASGTIGRAVAYSGEDAYFQDSNIVWLAHDETKILNTFLKYIYETLEWKTEGGTIKRLYGNVFNSVEIPVPSLETQQRIVDILDRFDSLTTSLTDGLPAEIAARRQQYEYYRDRLLTFPHKV